MENIFNSNTGKTNNRLDMKDKIINIIEIIIKRKNGKIRFFRYKSRIVININKQK